MALRAGHADVEQAGILLALFFAVVMQGVHAADDDARKFAAFAAVEGAKQDFLRIGTVVLAFVAADGVLQGNPCLL